MDGIEFIASGIVALFVTQLTIHWKLATLTQKFEDLPCVQKKRKVCTE